MALISALWTRRLASSGMPRSRRADEETDDGKQYYTLEQLQDKSTCETLGVTLKEREKYLSNADFEALFKVTKDEFEKKPNWKKETEKKKHKLF